MKYVLFTGITGQLGTALRGTLIEKGLPVACIIRGDGRSYGRFKILKADIRDKISLFRYSEEMRGAVDTLVHMAGVGHGHTDTELHDTVLKGSINVYEFAEEIGCRKFIFLSSILASGWVPPGRSCLSEDHKPVESRLCYFGKMKLEAEGELLRRAEKGLTKVTILRLGNVYGPPSKLSFVKFVADMLREKRRVFYHRAKDSVMWAPIHLQDVIDCLFLLIGKEAFYNQVYFLTGSEHCTLGCLAKILSDLIDVPLQDMKLNALEEADYYARKAFDRMRVVLGKPPFPDHVYSNKKIERDMGFRPKVAIDEGVTQTVRWGLAEGLL